MIYFTSDLHINHTNIINYCDRPFKNVDDMNKYIITHWNNTVQQNDTVYILGDMFFHHKATTKQYVTNILQTLNGKKILIRGNHDRDIQIYKRLDIPVYEELKMFIANRLCLLSHYPYRPSFFKNLWQRIRGFKVKHHDKRPINNGLILLHGHTHQFDKVRDRSIHVGWDAWNKLVSIRDIEGLINQMHSK